MLGKIYVYVGTYTCPIRFGTGQILEGKGKGIYLLELDYNTGKLKHLETFYNIINPSYLVLNNTHKSLYAVNELKEFEGKASGSVSSFAVSEDGRLTYINTQATGGLDPCHVEINPQGTHIYVSNFMSGSVVVYPLEAGGPIGEALQFIQHEGSSIDPKRQIGPHAHSVVFSPDGSYAFVPDLGLDKLMIYKVNEKTKTLEEAPVPYLITSPGAGPRHCVFDYFGKYCYVINELDCTILTLSYCANRGSFTVLQSISSLPDGVCKSGNTCADVHISPSGDYLYGSNRGHDSLVIYRIDKGSGMLSYVGCQSCGGKTPRNFAIDPTGRYLMCANQDSDLIIVFDIDPNSGYLIKKSEISIPTPVCIRPYIFNA